MGWWVTVCVWAALSTLYLSTALRFAPARKAAVDSERQEAGSRELSALSSFFFVSSASALLELQIADHQKIVFMVLELLRV